MTQPDPKPIRKSDLPTIPSPEWEFHTWFPHPDGGGDMVPGQRQRGVLVRRRVSYSDWEPVRPDRWADEDDAAPAVSGGVSPATDQTALRDRIAEALYPTYGQQDRNRSLAIADAVLAVLPASVDRAAVLDRIRGVVRRLANHAVGFQDVLDDSDRDPWGKTVGADIAELRTALDELAAERPLSPFYEHPDRGFRWHGRDGMDIPMRDGQPVCPRCELAAAETRNTTETDARCGPVPDECGDEPCANHERGQSHAENDHSLCSRADCEVLRQS
jgi:hypothetical protein